MTTQTINNAVQNNPFLAALTEEQLEAVAKQLGFNAATAPNAGTAFNASAAFTPEPEVSTFDKATGYLREAAFVGTDVLRATGVATRIGLHWVADRIVDAGNIVEVSTEWVASTADQGMKRTEDETKTFITDILAKYKR